MALALPQLQVLMGVEAGIQKINAFCSTFINKKITLTSEDIQVPLQNWSFGYVKAPELHCFK